MSVRSFLVIFLESSMCSSRTSASSDNFTSFFQLAFFFFLFLLWLLWLELPKLCWIKAVKVGILVFSLIVKEMFSAFHHWVWCYLWFYNIWPSEREREKFIKIHKIRLLAWVLIDIYKYFASSLWELYFSGDYFCDSMNMSLSTLQKTVKGTSPMCSTHIACCSS